MTNLRVKFTVLERNPDSHIGNNKTVAPFFEKTKTGIVQGYVSTTEPGYSKHNAMAVVLVDDKLQTISLEDITVLTDQS